MATLSLIRRGAIFDHKLATAAPLVEWLRGDWGLLFSHPDDFAHWDLEADRWLAIVQDTFSQAQVRPIALASGKRRPGDSWITQISDGRDSMLVLETPRHLRSDFVEANSSGLRSAICRAPSRFVMMIDPALRLRRTFGYAPQARLPSLLDLAATVAKARSESRHERDEADLVDWTARAAFASQALLRSRQTRAYA